MANLDNKTKKKEKPHKKIIKIYNNTKNKSNILVHAYYWRDYDNLYSIVFPYNRFTCALPPGG